MITLLNDLRNALATLTAEYKIIRRRIIKILFVIFLFSLLAVGFNFWGWRSINALIGCILPFVVLFAFTSPVVLGAILIAGIVSYPRHPAQQVEKIATIVAKIFGQIILVASIFFLLVGTLPFGRNFGAIFVVYLCLGILLLVNIQGIRHTRWFMPLLYGYVVTSFILAIGSMVPRATHVKLYGHDFFSWSRISLVEEAYGRIESAEREVSERDLANQLAVIENKIKKGQPLTTNEQSVKAYAKVLRDTNTAPAKAKEKWRDIFPPKVSFAPPPRNLGWLRWEIKQTTNAVVRVYNGDEFVYRSPSAFKVTEPNGDYFHNSSMTPEEVRSFKFYNLPADGWEIKILPADGTNVFWLDFRIEGRRTS